MNVRARFRIVTPMFAGGADHKRPAELRVPSIKGALRFWWRALEWSRIQGTKKSTDAALAILHRNEEELFGSAYSGQSSVLLQIAQCQSCDRPIERGAILQETLFPEDRPGARYLGYGVMDFADGQNTKAGRLSRACIVGGVEFTLVVRTSNTAISQTVLDALKLLGLLGGLGSKSRKGYGSLSLVDWQGTDAPWSPPSNQEDYVEQIRRLLDASRGVVERPPFSAFSRKTRISLLLYGGAERYGADGEPQGRFEDDPMAVLDQYGRQMQRYRSWGKDNMVNGEPSEKNFKLDHDWGKYISRPFGFHPQRVVFGLPHNYGKSPSQEVTPEVHDRRASPLLFHVHDLGPTASPRYLGIATIMEADFLPENEKIQAGKGTLVDARPRFSVLHEFFDGYIGQRHKKTGRRYFPNACEVFP